MKKLSLLILSLLIYSVGRSQGQVVDRHPASQIFAIDYQSGQEIQVAGDQAIAFKDAFIDLVSATPQSRQILRMTPGRKMAVIKQIDPQQKINGYQLTWQSVTFNGSRPLCTFYYNINENALYYFDPGINNWAVVPIEGPNQANLDNCRAYANFNGNQQGGMPDLSANGQQGTPDLSANGNQDQATADMQTGLDTLSNEDIQASVAPPELPQYEQPPCPTDGYLWQPGYWGWNPVAVDYYWVPGVWVAPPHPGLLWTPGYWGFVNGIYLFHHGYWGATVGFYGGIHYGFGYVGVGFVGGGWHGNVFRYNTAVVHVNTVVVHNTYVDNTVIRNTTVVNNRTSFNGSGGVTARPTATEMAAAHEQHFAPTRMQVAHQQASFSDRSQFASANGGRPSVTTQSHVTANPAMINNHNNFSRPNNTGNPGQPRGNNGNGFNNQPRPNNGGNVGGGNPNQQRPNNTGNVGQQRPGGGFQNGNQKQVQQNHGNFNRQPKQPKQPKQNRNKKD